MSKFLNLSSRVFFPADIVLKKTVRVVLIVSALLLPFQVMTLVPQEGQKLYDVPCIELVKVSDNQSHAGLVPKVKGTAGFVYPLLSQNQLNVLQDSMGYCWQHSQQDVFLQPHEWKELQIDWLCNSLDPFVNDKAYSPVATLFGSIAFRQLLSAPVNKSSIIKERQEVVQKLNGNNDLFNRCTAYLNKIRASQHALTNMLTNSTEYVVLSKDAMRLYYSIPFFAKYLNNSQSALDAIMIKEFGMSSIHLLCLMGLNGVRNGLNSLFYDERAVVDFKQWIRNGINEPLRQLNPKAHLTRNWAPRDQNNAQEHARSQSDILPDVVVEEPVPGMIQPNWGQYLNGLFNGTLGDRYRALRRGYNRPIEGTGPTWLSHLIAGTPAQPVVLAAAAAGTISAGYFFLLGVSINDAINHIKTMNTRMEQLRLFMVDVAGSIRSMRRLALLIKRSPLADTVLGQQIAQAFDKKRFSPELKELFNLLEQETFDVSGVSSSLYSRGRVLHAYHLLKKVSSEIAPMLQAVGTLDVYCALAHLHAAHGWNFVEFIDGNKPVMEIHEFKTPVFENPTANSVKFGDDYSTKMILTGPNMGGKSVVIRLFLGHTLVLAQSCGIIPAESCRMSLFDGIFTNIDPQEDMKGGISTFMAEKKAMDRLIKILDTTDSSKKVIILLDEPYTGTVNDSTARRSGAFCRSAEQKDNAVVVVATHILPTFDDNKECTFSHAHVDIQEPTRGQFKATHQLKQTGPCRWWFEDEARRERYIDWLGKYSEA